MGRTDFELQNFASLLNEEVKSLINEQGDSGFREAAFTQVAMDHLVNAQETGNVQTCTCVHRNAAGNRLRQLNGYALWDGYETLDLFIADFRGEGSIYTLEKNRLLSAFNQLTRYFTFALKGDYEGLEESAEEQEFLQNFDYFNEDLLRVRLILITDGIVKSETPAIKSPNKELTLIPEIWDLERLYQLWTSQRKREPIELNIAAQFNYNVSVLSCKQENEKYDTYLAVVPGNLLADLYDVYGSRLLEQNVRVFLQNLGKVNRGIRKTILESPEMFLAYNNGISTTASELEITEIPGKEPVLGKIMGLQIVNGGQTTSSIYYARKKDRANLENVLVQMKITVIPDSDQLEQMVSNISRYANSQNRVSEVDLTSNQTMHILLEELSRTTWAPAQSSSDNQTRWYYERVKGQYKEELNKEHTKSRRLNFKKRNPTNQVVRKEQLAKYHQTWRLLPYWVVRGSQKNYLNFMTAVERFEPDRIFFRKIIAKAILFRTGERLYGKKPNAMGDLRYLVVPYALAWLNYKTEDSIALERIWENQGGSDELEGLLRQILLKTNSFFQEEKPEEYALVSEWAKKEDCWEKLKRKSASDWELDLNRIKDDLSTEKPDTANTNELDQKRGELEHLTIENWEKIEQFGVETKLLELYQISLVRNIMRRLKKQQPLTESMVEHGSVILSVWQKANETRM